MPTISIQEAQAKLLELIHQLSSGDEVLITENNQPVARLVPTIGAKTKSKLSRPVLIRLVAAGLLGVAVLAGVVISLRVKDGTLTVEVNQPDAVVQVLSEEGKVEISEPGGLMPISISVVPGKHRITVEKDGFVTIGDNFEIASGGKLDIRARLVPKAKQVDGQANKSPAKPTTPQPAASGTR